MTAMWKVGKMDSLILALPQKAITATHASISPQKRIQTTSSWPLLSLCSRKIPTMISSPNIQLPNAGQTINSVHIQTTAQGIVTMNVNHHHICSFPMLCSRSRKEKRIENLALKLLAERRMVDTSWNLTSKSSWWVKFGGGDSIPAPTSTLV